MKIIVTIKQVPETSSVKLNPETGTMIRDGAVSIINPLDLYAIEAAVQLKEEFGGQVIALSMGPRNTVKALKEAIAMGCDDAILVSDRKFSGADTWSTSYVLSEAIKKIGDFDLIISGERATDGDTGQVGPSIASALDLPLVSFVSKLVSVSPDEEKMLVERLIEEGYETVETEMPALITVVKEINHPRLPTLRGKQKARDTDLDVFNFENMEVEESFLGLKGSPTRVVKIHRPKVTRGGEIIKASDDESIEKAIDRLTAFLEEKELI